MLVTGFMILAALSAQVRLYLPGNPVPVTMQTAAVLLCGFCLRPGLAMAAMALYLAGGIVGDVLGVRLPFFAAVQVGMATATAGYLVAFVPAAGLVSALARQRSSLTFGRAVATGAVGMSVIFLFGVTWLAWLTGSLDVAIQNGLLPFLPWTAAKIGLVAAAVQLGRPLSVRRDRRS